MNCSDGVRGGAYGVILLRCVKDGTPGDGNRKDHCQPCQTRYCAVKKTKQLDIVREKYVTEDDGSTRINAAIGLNSRRATYKKISPITW
eukprot:scaffold8383_cov23-Cyclotella_meneghiniana.AAC.1